MPNFKRLGFIGTKTGPLAIAELDALRGITGLLGFELVHYSVQTIDDIETAVAATSQDGVDVLVESKN